MTEESPKGRKLELDPNAESASPSLPAFIARPPGAPVYHGFPILEDSATDGWFLGVITAFEDPAGSDWGDAFVVAPDGSRAGLVWSVGDARVEAIGEPSDGRWGVYAVGFPRVVRNRADIIDGFRAILPALKAIKLRSKQPRAS